MLCPRLLASLCLFAWAASAPLVATAQSSLEGATPAGLTLTKDAAPRATASLPRPLALDVQRIDEVEPNNSVAQAQELMGASPLVVDGMAASDDEGDLTITYRDSDGNEIGTDDLEDLFLVTTTATGLTLELSGFTGDLDLILIDEAATEIIESSATQDNPEIVRADTLPAGTYLVAVSFYDAEGDAGTSSYRLQLTGSFSGAPTEEEPNDNLAQAQVLMGTSPIVITGNAESADQGEISISYNDANGNPIGTDDFEDLYLVTTTAVGLTVTLSDFSEDLDMVVADDQADAVIEGAYTAESSEVITLDTLPAGTYLIAVNFYEAEGATGETSYRLQLEGTFGTGGGGGGNNAPTVQHTPGGAATAGQAYAVTATLTDDDGIQSATLFYRQGGTAAFEQTAMTGSGNAYTAEIPAGSVTARGLEYYVGAEDTRGASARTSSFFPGVNVSGDGLLRTVSLPSSEAGAYRLVSVPLQLNNTQATSVFADDLGAYDDSVWRLYSLSADQNYAEFPNVAAVVPGRAFWLGAKSAVTFDTGAGSSVSLNQPFRVSLNPGWNLVGSPFNFNVPLNQVRMGSGQALDIRAYNGTSWNALTGALQPFTGYAVFAEAADELIIGQAAPTATATRRLPGASQAEAAGWELRLSARRGLAEDTDNVAHVHARAADGRDPWDRPEPPVIGDYVSAYFVPPSADAPSKRLSTDARALGHRGQTWTLEGRSAQPGRVDLEVDLSAVPDGYAVWLVDEVTQVRHDAQKASGVAFVHGGEGEAHRFSLIVEEADLWEDEGPDAPVVTNYPNPFSHATTVQFGLPEPGHVTLTVHDALGRQVATLGEGSYDAGFHSAVWDGRDAAGRVVASGLYVYRLETGQAVYTGTMVVMK